LIELTTKLDQTKVYFFLLVYSVYCHDSSVKRLFDYSIIH